MNLKLRKIITSGKRERRFVENTCFGSIIASIIHMNDYCVYIYGGGNDIETIVTYCEYLKLDIKGIIDRDINKKGKYVLGKIPFIHTSQLNQIVDSTLNNFVIINTGYFAGLEQSEILDLCKSCGIKKYYALNDFEKYQIKGHNPLYKQYNFAKYFFEHIEDLENTLNMLYDVKSKETMCEYIRVYMESGIYHLPQCDGRNKYFRGEDTITGVEELYEKYQDEVWINCGSNIGDTIFLYFDGGLNAKCIYAYEGDEKIYDNLISNLKYLPDEYRKKVNPINKYVDCKMNFMNDINEKITLINADIEGEERSMLLSLCEVIKTDRPVIAVCVYHLADDLVKIPKIIDSMVEDYVYVMRKYQASAYSVNEAAEVVLYAIPKERCLL